MSTEGTRTDRGYVVISEMSDNLLHVQICQSVSPDDQPVNIYAEHVGVEKVETDVREGLKRSGTALLSQSEVEVFVDADTGVLSIMDVAPSTL